MLRFALAAAFSLLLAACGGSAPASVASKPAPSTVTVFAAASLLESFNDLAPAFAAQSGGDKVIYNFDGSQALRTQLEQGAKADVFASANTDQMDKARGAGLLAIEPKIFARNKLAIITPKANPAAIYEPKDLGKPKVKLVLAAKDVPVGGYFQESLAKMSADPTYGSGFKQAVLNNVISEETNVKQVVAKVQLGEADAGVAYTTDVSPSVAGDVNILVIPDQFNVIATYPIASLKSAPRPQLAQRFVDYVLSASGQNVLAKYGFIRAGS